MAEIFGIEVGDLPEGWVPLTAVVIVNCLGDDGQRTLAIRPSEEIADWEAAGMALAAADAFRRDTQDGWSSE